MRCAVWPVTRLITVCTYLVRKKTSIEQALSGTRGEPRRAEWVMTGIRRRVGDGMTEAMSARPISRARSWNASLTAFVAADGWSSTTWLIGISSQRV